MTKFNNVNQITGEPGGESPSMVPTGGGDDWLSRIHGAINSFTEAMKIMKELRGMGQGMGEEVIDQGGGPLINPGGAPKANPGLAKFLAQYGDMTIDELLELIKPMTVKKLMEVISRGAGPGK